METFKTYIPAIIVLLLLIAFLVMAFMYSFLSGLLAILLLIALATAYYNAGRVAQMKEINDKLMFLLDDANKNLGKLTISEQMVWGLVKSQDNDEEETKAEDNEDATDTKDSSSEA